MRLINQIRCWASYALSAVGIQRIEHLPTFVSIEPADFCQLTCPECPVGRRQTNGAVHGVMQPADYKRIVDEVKSYVHTIQLFWQGEPLLNNSLPEMIRLARMQGIYTIVSTNAQRLDRAMAECLVQAGLNRIIVSMDGWTQTTYEQYRQGGDVEKVKQAVRWLREAKEASHSRIQIELQCLKLRTNETEWGIMRREYKRLGADRLTLKTAQLYDYGEGSPLMPSDERHSRYRYDAKAGNYVPKRKMRNRCYRLWSGCVIDVQGNVMPCCYDKGKQYILGNIHTQPLSDIWRGEKAELFRRQVLSRRADIPICTNCDE